MMSKIAFRLSLLLVLLLAVGFSTAAADVKIAADGAGYKVVTPVYTAQVDATGSIQSLQIGGTEFMQPRTTYVDWQGKTVQWPGTACGRNQGGGRPLKLEPLNKIASLNGTTLRAEGDRWWVEYRFLDDAVEYSVGGTPAGIAFDSYPKVFFCWSLARGLARACDPSNQGELGWPLKRYFADGPLTVLDSKGAGLTGLPICTLMPESRDWPLLLYMPAEQLSGQPLPYRLQLFARADLAHSLKLEVIPPNPDHLFTGDTPAAFPVRAEVLYGHELQGKLVYSGEPFVWKTPQLTVEIPLSLNAAAPAQTLPLTVKVPKPGQYTGTVSLTDGKQTLAAKRLGFVWRPERIPPAPVPADFDKFWDETLAELARIPLDLELTPQPNMETAAGQVFKAKFRSWGGRWAWAWLHVPKSPNKVPATVVCPPVSNYQPGQARPYVGDLRIWAAVHGGDLSRNAAEKDFTDFDYMNSWIDSRESYALRYSYCNLVRCFDIIKSLPQCDGTVFVQGGSQGAGLSLVLAGLRPAAEVIGANVALCRIDWTVLGHTRWGPKCPEGADPQKIAAVVTYYDPARFTHRIRCKVRLGTGHFDWCAPTEAVISALNGLPAETPREFYADPFGDHFNSDLNRLYHKAPAIEIPRWQGTDEENKVAK